MLFERKGYKEILLTEEKRNVEKVLLTEENSSLIYQSMVRYINHYGTVGDNWDSFGFDMTDEGWADIEKRISREPIEFIASDWGLFIIAIKKHFL